MVEDPAKSVLCGYGCYFAYLDAPKRSDAHVKENSIEHRHGDELRTENISIQSHHTLNKTLHLADFSHQNTWALFYKMAHLHLNGTHTTSASIITAKSTPVP